jgi:TolB-like protein
MIGRSIGRYSIVAKLGEGGMGSVWKAEDPVLERTIALKFLPESLASSPDGRRRFLREARAASQLHHPGIATVFDTGEHEGLFYIALLHVDGETLSEHIARGPLAIQEAVRIALEVADALGYAHLHGVLHRDITARNIMVKHEDGRAILVDFGLALPEKHSHLTKTGSAMGTVAYLSPEVAQGGEADRRSDLYGLGVVLYEMLTGRLPFAGDRAEAVLYATVHEPPSPPSRSNADVPPALDRIVLRALEKDRARRYQTAEELAADLREFLGPGAPGTSPGMDPFKTVSIDRLAGARRWPLGPRTTIILRRALGVGMLALIVALVMWRFGLFAPKRFERIAVLPLGSTSADSSDVRYLADGVSETLIAKLTETNLRVIPWMTASRYRDSPRPLPELARELHVDAVIVGTLRISGDRVHVSVSLVDAKSGLQEWADEVDEPREAIMVVQERIAVDAATRLKGRLSGQERSALVLAPSHSADAYDHFLKGQAALERGDSESNSQALAFFQRAVELDSNLAEAYVGMGAVHAIWGSSLLPGRQQNLAEAESNYGAALRLKPSLIGAYRGLVHLYWYREETVKCLEVGRAISRLGGEGIDHLLGRAEAYSYGGLPDKAVPLLEKVLQEDPSDAAALYNLVIAAMWACRPEIAIRAAQTYTDIYGDDGEFAYWKGTCYWLQNDIDRARAAFDPIVDGEHDEFVSDAGFDVGSFYKAIGEPEKAHRVLARNVGVLSHDPETIRRHPIWLLLYYAALGDRERCLEFEARILGTGSPSSNDFYCLALAHHLLGERSRGLEFLKRAADAGSPASGIAGYSFTGCPNANRDTPFAGEPAFVQLVAQARRVHDRLASQY